MCNQNETAVGASDFEWDENKRLSNIRKHAIDFLDAIEIFASNYVDAESKLGNEPRRKATGMLGDRYVTVVYTVRTPNIRLISARPARDNERRTYRAIYAGGDP
jgi:uncharacterized DUF497 family protein